MTKYKFIVWVGGCDDYFINYYDALTSFNYWIDQGYKDVIFEKINFLDPDKRIIIKRGE